MEEIINKERLRDGCIEMNHLLKDLNLVEKIFLTEQFLRGLNLFERKHEQESLAKTFELFEKMKGGQDGRKSN